MAYSYSCYKDIIKEYLVTQYDKNATILDVGPGCGTYYDLLKDYFTTFDGVEVFKLNIEKYNLKNKYRNIYNKDIKDFKFKYYDIIIIGDVLEHLTIEEAQKVLSYCEKRCKQLIVAVPYMLPQEAIEGNIYEIHKQPDLTKENMQKRYPSLKFLIGNSDYGYYVKQDNKDFSQEYMLNLIIPCYNLEKWIEPCLNSICIQNNNLNIKRKAIFICDNCTDNTENIIRETMKKSNWEWEIYIAHEGCAGGARNIGLEHCNSKYIWFIDGDDWLVGEDAIDTVLDCMLRDDMDIVQFKIRSNVNPLGEFGGGTVWTAMFSKRLIGDYRFNNRQNGEDNDFCEEMWNHRNPKFGKIALAPYFYNYPRKDSLSDIAYKCYSNQKAVFAMACTRNYYKYLYTWLHSLTKHNFYKKIYLIIEDDKLNLPFTNIEYININKIPLNPKGLNYNTGYTKAALARLYLADLLPNEEKVLYLDTDLLVLDNITELFDIDISNYYAAGVIDQGAKTNLMTPNINIDKQHYINSGVCLFNLKKIREDNKSKELDNYLNTNKLLYPDQDTINVVFKDKILFLDNKYNSSIFTGQANNFKIYHWAGGKEDWVYKREHGDLWINIEKQQDPDFKLKINE